MAGRGMLFAEGPMACPFVALESDRDRRSAEPDPRHRCYAEPTPAPRALAHQREYCLAPGFGGCPVFQDWAIRAAAQPVPLRPATDQPPPPAGGPQQLSAFEAPAAGDDEVIERVPSLPLPADEPPADEQPRADDEAEPVAPNADRTDGEAEPVAPDADAPDRDLETPPSAERASRRWTEDWPPSASAAATGAALGGPAGSGQQRASNSAGEPPAFLAPQAKPSPRDDRAAQRAELIPAWQRERYPAYPTLRTRMGLGDGDRGRNRLVAFFGAIAAVFLIVALIILVPGFLPAGGPGPTAPIAGSPTPPLGPTPTPTLEPTPEPTALTHRVQPGQTLFGIATMYGVTVDQILAANPSITNPNLIQVGQVIIIPPDDFGLPTPPPPPAPTPAATP